MGVVRQVVKRSAGYSGSMGSNSFALQGRSTTQSRLLKLLPPPPGKPGPLSLEETMLTPSRMLPSVTLDMLDETDEVGVRPPPAFDGG